VGSGGSIVFGTYQGKFAVIKSSVKDGTANTVGDLLFMTRNTTGDSTLTNRMTIKNTGNVGIGTVSPRQKLEVAQGHIAIVNNSYKSNAVDDQLAGKIDFHLGGDTGELAIPVAGIEAYDKYQSGGSYLGALAFKTVNSERMRIGASGNVGIGTADPATALHVRNPGGADIASSIIIQPASTTYARGYAKIEAYPDAAVGAGTGLKFYTRLDSGSDFDPASLVTERMTIKNDGNVGIGTTNLYRNSKLDVRGGIVLTGGSHGSRPTNDGSILDFSEISGQNTGDASAGFLRLSAGGYKIPDSLADAFSKTFIDICGYSSTTDFDRNISFHTLNSERMRIAQNGNVGIGTASPGAKLQVGGNAETSPQYLWIRGSRVNQAGEICGIHFYNSANSGDRGNSRIINSRGTNNYGSNLEFWTNPDDNVPALERMRILANGNVGIGTAGPIRKLDVRSGVGNSSAAWIGGAFGGTGNYPRVVMGALNSVACIGAHRYDLGAWEQLYLNDPTHNVVVNIGKVGIGIASPSYPLHVTGNAGAMPAMKYFNSASSGLQSGANDSITIYAAGNIYASGLIAASDERIKKNIVDADDSECLETLRLLKPKKYQYKDVIKRGDQPVWGFIAQEVRDTLQYATHLGTNALPNIYEVANVSQSNVITFTNFNTSNLEANAITIHVKTIHDKEERVTLAEVVDEHTIRVEEDLSAWTGSVDAEGNVITEITTTTLTPEEYEALEDKTGCVANISGYQNANVVISVEEYNGLEDTTGYEEVIENYTKTATIYPGTQLFVYGQEVDDFVYIKKEAIWTVATAALQEVDRQLQAEKVKVATLETQLADLLARVQALESA
jgi:hypothetical protein